MSQLFTQLHAAMRDKEQFKFTITREGELLSAMLQPLLGEAPDNLSDEASQARAALSVPLLLKATPAEFEQTVTGRFSEYNAVRGDLNGSYQALIENLKDASRSAAVSVQSRNKGKGPEKPKASPPNPVAAADEPDDADTKAASQLAKTPVTAETPAAQGGLFAE